MVAGPIVTTSDLPSQWVTRFAPLIPCGEVLDLACGRGRHAHYFRKMGCSVVAVDRDRSSLNMLNDLAILPSDPLLTVVELDLEADSVLSDHPLFSARRYAGIVVTNYLHRPLMPVISGCLAAGGVLIYETFGVGNAQFGKPSSGDFLLKPGELLEWVGSLKSQESVLEVIAYESGYVDDPAPAVVQRICVRRTDVGDQAHPLLSRL